MSEIVFHAHSGLRYLVLLAGAALAVWSLVGVAGRVSGRRPVGRTSRILASVFTGVLDLQVVVGLVLILVRPFRMALMGHVAMMVLAAGLAHGTAVANRKRAPGEKSHVLGLVGGVGALLLIIGGILAIQRPIL